MTEEGYSNNRLWGWGRNPMTGGERNARNGLGLTTQEEGEATPIEIEK